MKKIVISLLLVLTLVLGASLVACDDSEYDDYEEPQTQNTEGEDKDTDNTTDPADPDDSDVEGSDGADESDKPVETQPDSVLDVSDDTDEGWGVIHRK